MSQIYLNGPSVGRAISAEEFAAGACQRPGPQPSASGCGCGSAPAPSASPVGCGCGTVSGCSAGDCGHDCGQDGGYCQQMICCCRPAPAPAPQPPQVEEGCCCKQSFRAALGLLCDERISSLLDFDKAAFITNTYTAGAALQGGRPYGGAQADGAARSPDGQADVDAKGRPNPPAPCGSGDNLGRLSGSFRRFSPCTCDLIEISAEVYTAAGKGCGLYASQVNLCQLDAVVIQGAAGAAEGDLSADEVTDRNFRCVRSLLAQRLNPCGGPCGQNGCSCACDGRACCCAAGLLDTLSQNNLSRRVSLAAGLLVLENVTLLGTVGNVLVLSNDCDNRLYFVCVNSVELIG